MRSKSFLLFIIYLMYIFYNLMENQGAFNFSSLVKSFDNNKDEEKGYPILTDKKKKKSKKSKCNQNKHTNHSKEKKTNANNNQLKKDFKQPSNYNQDESNVNKNREPINLHPYNVMNYNYLNSFNPLIFSTPQVQFYTNQFYNPFPFYNQQYLGTYDSYEPQISNNIVNKNEKSDLKRNKTFSEDKKKLEEVNEYNDELEKILSKKSFKFIALKSFLSCDNIKLFLSKDSVIKDIVLSFTNFNVLSYTQKHILIDALFMKLLPELNSLLPEKKFNIIVKFILKRITQEQVKEAFSSIKGNLLSLCSDQISKNSILALIRPDLHDSVQTWITQILKDCLFLMATNQNASEIIQKIISKFSEQGKSEIVSFILKSFLQLAQNQNGIEVIKKHIIDIQNNNVKKSELLEFIEPYLSELFKFETSLPTIEAILEFWKVEECFQIVDFLHNGFFAYSQNSNSVRLLDIILESKATSVSKI